MELRDKSGFEYFLVAIEGPIGMVGAETGRRHCSAY
jgi:hypothetical protein